MPDRRWGARTPGESGRVAPLLSALCGDVAGADEMPVRQAKQEYGSSRSTRQPLLKVSRLSGVVRGFCTDEMKQPDRTPGVLCEQ